MNLGKSISIAAIGLTLVGCSARKSPGVAEVLGKQISTAEFEDRYRKYIAQFGQRDNILLRKQIVTNMINEELIFDDIRRCGLDSDPAAVKRLQEIRLQALLDAYAKQVSTDTMTVSDGELQREFLKFNTHVTARYVYAKSEEGALELKRRLEHGETFESMARFVFEDPDLAENGGYLGSFGWGEMEPALEQVAFSSAVGSLSDPVRLSMGYAIVKVESRFRMPLASEYDFAKNRERLEKEIRTRKTLRYISNAVDHSREELEVEVNRKTLLDLYQHWEGLAAHERTVDPERLPLVMRSVNEELVTYRGGAWTISDFLQRLEFTSKKQRRRLRSIDDLKALVIGLVVREGLLQEARDSDLDDTPGVNAQITRVRDEYLLKRWASHVQDTVGQHGWSEELLLNEYRSRKGEFVRPPEVNVAEILVRTRDEALATLGELKQGKDFGHLAEVRSIRRWAAKRSGELGYGDKLRFGALGEKFFAARVGDLVGPEYVDPYFGVFKIIGKREPTPLSLEEAKPQIIAGIALSRKRQVLHEAIEALRKRTAFQIDMVTLANVSMHPMAEKDKP